MISCAKRRIHSRSAGLIDKIKCDAGGDVFVDLTVGVAQFKGTGAIRGADQHRLLDRREVAAEVSAMCAEPRFLCRKISGVPNDFHISACFATMRSTTFSDDIHSAEADQQLDGFPNWIGRELDSKSACQSDKKARAYGKPKQPDESQSAEAGSRTERQFFRRAQSSPWPGRLRSV